MQARRGWWWEVVGTSQLVLSSSMESPDMGVGSGVEGDFGTADSPLAGLAGGWSLRGV